MKTSYNSRQKKIYEDYSVYSSEKLKEYIENESKYRSDVIEIIQDISIERQEIETTSDSFKAAQET